MQISFFSDAHYNKNTFFLKIHFVYHYCPIKINKRVNPHLVEIN